MTRRPLANRRTMINLLLIPVVIILFVLWLMWNEPRTLYHPNREIELTPDKLGIKYEDITLTTSDGIHINGWFLPGEIKGSRLDS